MTFFCVIQFSEPTLKVCELAAYTSSVTFTLQHGECLVNMVREGGEAILTGQQVVVIVEGVVKDAVEIGIDITACNSHLREIQSTCA